METMEWSTVDKSTWGEGPWQREPDKRQWKDKATGLPCLIVRGPAGALCGYVGVAPDHPLHGKGYSEDKVFPCDDECSEDWHYHCSVACRVTVHGGLTFADSCSHFGPDEWENAKKRFASAESEARKYPRGDSSEFRKSIAPVIDNYEAWRERMQQSHICHIAAPGEPDSVWWFGFDCAHAGDLCPKFDHEWERSGCEDYKDIGYVTAQVTELAAQLHRLASVPVRRQAGAESAVAQD